MARILEFKLPEKSRSSKTDLNAVVSSSVDDVMLIIHHALHGTDKEYQPKDHQLATKLLDLLSCHIKNNHEEDYLVLEQSVSQEILVRYPESYQNQSKNRGR